MRFILPLILSLFILSSCNEYQKVLKNEDIKPKYELAEKYYNEGDYKRAQRLFEQIAPRYIGKPQGERIMFFFADTYFKTNSFYLAGFQFERFIKSYPNSDKVQEASFLEAKSYFILSPKYSLDQSDTDKASGKLQNFINNYPESEFFDEANTMAQELTIKKEKKEIEIAKQFDKIGEFRFEVLVSAIASLDNFIADNPGSTYREDAFYYRVKAATNLALNSTQFRMESRLKDAMDMYNALVKSYPDTKYSKEAENLHKKILRQLKGFEKEPEKDTK